MRRTWSWSTASGGGGVRVGVGAAAALRIAVVAAAAVLVALAAAGAATVLERTVEIAIQPGGSVREHDSIQVRLDEARDLDGWSSYSIFLDENRTLTSADAYVLQPDGKRAKVGRKDRDSVDSWGGGILHTSARFHVLEFTGLRVGSVLAIDSVVEERPYFPAGQVLLALDDPTDHLRVAISGAGAGWRWHLDGPADGIRVEEDPGGVVVTGRRARPAQPAAAGAGRRGGGADAALRLGERGHLGGGGPVVYRAGPHRAPRHPRGPRQGARSWRRARRSPGLAWRPSSPFSTATSATWRSRSGSAASGRRPPRRC